MEDPETLHSTPFESFCIVCDRAILPPKEIEAVKTKKKAAAGTIRIKNPNGTVTTYNANGQKTVRPTLKRGPSSQNRLVVAATNNNATVKLQPLTRSKTAESPLPSAATESTPAAAPSPPESPFYSTIYCSKACALVEASRSVDLTRRLSYEPKLEVITTNIGSPYGPPSPLYMGSDTSSDPDAPSAYSAPNTEFFRISREGPDAAWREVERQRRSSVHPASRPTAMVRGLSSHSAISGEPSSDSLSSMWQDELARSTSARGELRMTPAHHPLRRGSSSSGSEKIHVRSNLSQVSIASSPERDLPPEFGSAPNHTYNLWTSYHSAFAVRDSTGTSANSQRGFVFPGSHAPAMRRNSSSRGGINSGTVRVKSKTDVTWDSFGRDEVLSRTRLSAAKSDVTPKQSVEGDLRVGLSRGDTIRPLRTTRSNSIEEEHPNAMAIPRRPLAVPANSPHASHTPTTIRPHLAQSHRATTGLPDLASLRVGATCAPYLSGEMARPSSAPKSTFNWDEFEKKGGKVYEVPKALKVNTTKAGLFFFK